MKKFIVKYKNSGKIFGEYSSRKEASDILMEYIYYFNDCSGGDYISPFDFVLEEVGCGEVNEAITDFETARKFLGIKPNDDIAVVRKKHSESDIQFDDVASLVDDINQKHIEALMALNKLFTIAEAWNKADGFVPDYSDWYQDKWFPWFRYDKGTARFVYAAADYAPTNADAIVGSRLCFKTKEHAAQFGKQFEELYNKVFLITNK